MIMNSITQKIHTANIGVNPRLLYESLGSKMIESDSIVIAEQIKNSVDAKAKNIVVDFSEYENDLITISDQGNGMTLDEIKSNWLFVASDNKVDSLSLGGKGVGRFSLFRLAESIHVKTISEGKVCEFSLEKIQLQEDTINDVNVQITENVSQENCGTTISLSRLKKNINFLEIQQELENLNANDVVKKYEIKYPMDIELADYLTPEEAVVDAPFHASIVINSDQTIDYNFHCNLGGKVLYKNSTMSLNYEKDSTTSFGLIKFEIYNFYFAKGKFTKSLKYGYRKLTDEFLSAYQGISIYRNDFKIYGHGTEDWLKLAEKRLERAGGNIDNKQTYGYIILDSESTSALEEKTNREGFIRTDASKQFKSLIEIIVKQFGKDREESIKAITNHFKVVNPPSPGPNPSTSGAENGGNEDTGDNSNPGSIGGTGNPANTSTGGNSSSGISDPSGNPPYGSGSNPPSPGNPGTGSPPPLPKGNPPSKRLGGVDFEIYKKIKSDKVKTLLSEITNIDFHFYKNATAFLFRSLLEISMDEYIRKNFSQLESSNYFKDFIKDSSGNIKLGYPGINGGSQKIVEPKTHQKIKALYEYLIEIGQFDPRMKSYYPKLTTFIADINFTIHRIDGTVFVQDLQNHWTQSKSFLELLCSSI
jgi:hypothetical protein